LQFRDVLDDLAVLSDEIATPIKTMIQSAADHEREKIAGKGFP
jgi:hypothetical protein